MQNLKFRAWDKEKCCWINESNKNPFWIIGETTMFDILKQYQIKDYNNIVVQQFSQMKDKNDNDIFDGDILSIETADGYIIHVTCKFGIARRTMSTGWEVDIPSFYFEREDGLKSFPIVNNSYGVHDLQMIEIVGHIFEETEIGEIQ